MYLAQLEIGFEKNEAADRSLRAYKASQCIPQELI
jgi:hypothetical protein